MTAERCACARARGPRRRTYRETLLQTLSVTASPTPQALPRTLRPTDTRGEYPVSDSPRRVNTGYLYPVSDFPGESQPCPVRLDTPAARACRKKLGANKGLWVARTQLVPVDRFSAEDPLKKSAFLAQVSQVTPGWEQPVALSQTVAGIADRYRYLKPSEPVPTEY
jgi:hypothetical protein